MRFLSRNIWFVSIMGVLLISACEKDENTLALSNVEEIDNQKGQAPSVKEVQSIPSEKSKNTSVESEALIDSATLNIKDITEGDFKSGVFIDFDSFKMSFFNDDIFSKLRSNLEAVVAQDQEKFAEHLHENYTRHSVFFDKQNVQYMFYDLDILTKFITDGKTRINVGVRFAIQDPEGKVENTGLTFFFMKNKEDHWKIINID